MGNHVDWWLVVILAVMFLASDILFFGVLAQVVELALKRVWSNIELKRTRAKLKQAREERKRLRH